MCRLRVMYGLWLDHPATAIFDDTIAHNLGTRLKFTYLNSTIVAKVDTKVLVYTV